MSSTMDFSNSKILILEQDPAVAGHLLECIEKLGPYEAMVLSDASAALNLIRSGSFSLVLSDVEFGGESGLEFAQQIRKDRISKPEIVLLSAEPKISIYDCHQAGVCHILKLPVNMEELAAILLRSGNARRFERLEIDATVMGRLFGNVQLSGEAQDCKAEIKNIGRGGFYYKIPQDAAVPSIGQILDFELSLTLVPNFHFLGKGIVRWLHDEEGTPGVGVEFLVIPEDSEKMVVAFVDLFKIQAFVPSNS